MKNREAYGVLYAFKTLFVIVLTSLCSHITMAQSFEIKSDTNVLRIGEQTELHLKIVAAQDGWTLPEVSDTIGVLTVVNSGQWDSSALDGQRVYQREITVTCFDSGYHAIQPLMATRAHDTLYGDGLFFEVKTVGELQEEPYDIKAPLDAPKTLLEWLTQIALYGLLPLALIVLGYIFYTKYRKNDGERETEMEPALSPDEWLRSEWDSIERQALWRSDLPKNFYDRLTDALRQYIAMKYSIRTTEMVSDEIELVLKNREPFRQNIDQLMQLLRKADRAKFAKGYFSEEVMEQDFQRAREIGGVWIVWQGKKEGGEDDA